MTETTALILRCCGKSTTGFVQKMQRSESLAFAGQVRIGMPRSRIELKSPN
jgi:hypothetical protein